jgi:DNA modification methylase
MRHWKNSDGLIVYGDAFSPEVRRLVVTEFGVSASKRPIDPGYDRPAFKLTILDPPYGEITGERWDHSDYNKWFELAEWGSAEDATICVWGGVGKSGNRPFLKFAAEVEERYGWRIKNWITWGKKRAYGVQDNYLFTREECLVLALGTPTFHIPLLETKRGYAGYSEKYPAKSEYLRRTNVWTDITEILRGKIHPTQKPDRLYEVLVETHSDPGDVVFDPCAGSLTTARAAKKLGRRYCVCEREWKYIEASGLVESESESESEEAV